MFRLFVSTILLVSLLGCNLKLFKTIPDSDVVLRATSESELLVMDFSRPISIDPTEPGWYHLKFLTHPPMAFDFVSIDGIDALQFSTDDSASMLFRYVDIPLQEYPFLNWQWRVDETIVSEADPASRAGDDHPARLYVRFITEQGAARNMEIIWSNEKKAGEYKFLDSDQFPHYVARGGDENLQQWWIEEINLLEIYKTLWPDNVPANISLIAIFCDSDDTDSSSISYFSYVKVNKNGQS